MSDELPAAEIEPARARRLEAMALQEIEGNPLTLADTQIFDMFERDRWSHERRRAYLLERALEAPPPSAGPVPLPDKRS